MVVCLTCYTLWVFKDVTYRDARTLLSMAER